MQLLYTRLEDFVLQKIKQKSCGKGATFITVKRSCVLNSSCCFQQGSIVSLFFSNLSFEVNVLIKLFLYQKRFCIQLLHASIENYTLQETKQNKKYCGKGIMSIIVKWSLNFQTINLNIHSLLNENIKCVKLKMTDCQTDQQSISVFIILLLEHISQL